MKRKEGAQPKENNKKEEGTHKGITKGKRIRSWPRIGQDQVAATCTRTEPKDARILCEKKGLAMQRSSRTIKLGGRSAPHVSATRAHTTRPA